MNQLRDINELRELLKTKAFKSTVCGQVYKFVSDNLLQVRSGLANSAPYTIKEEYDNFILEHNNLIGDEPLIMEIVTLKYPMTISLIKKFSQDFLTTFIEE